MANQYKGVLIACEHSGTIRDKCIDNGILAFSCDLLEGEGVHTKYHLQGDIFEVYNDLKDIVDIEIMIGHPSCQFLANSGVSWLVKPVSGKPHIKQGSARYQEMLKACKFFNDLRSLPIKFKALENPIPHKYAKAFIGEYDMLTHPYHHGHEESKATCFWLNNLPPLFKTKIVDPIKGSALHRLPPSKDRWKQRSKTYEGISNAIFDQWIRPVMKGNLGL